MATVPSVPLPAATLILLRDKGARPEVLLLRRNRATRFAPGAYVFPGGRVDASDGSDAMARLWDGLDPEAARVRLGLAPGALPSAMAYYGAAVRETFEETGLVACAVPRGEVDRPDAAPAPCQSPAVSAARESLLEGGDSFAPVLRRLGVRLDGAALEYVAHWVTPAASPHRYDTRFFAAGVPVGTQIVPDERETTGAVWLSPRDALARHREGGLSLMHPTRRTLEDFQAFSSVDALLSFYRGRPVPRIQPEFVRTPG